MERHFGHLMLLLLNTEVPNDDFFFRDFVDLILMKDWRTQDPPSALYSLSAQAKYDENSYSSLLLFSFNKVSPWSLRRSYDIREFTTSLRAVFSSNASKYYYDNLIDSMETPSYWHIKFLLLIFIQTSKLSTEDFMSSNQLRYDRNFYLFSTMVTKLEDWGSSIASSQYLRLLKILCTFTIALSDICLICCR